MPFALWQHLLNWRQGGAHEEINLVLKSVNLHGVFLKLSVDPLFHLLEMLIDGVSS